MNFTLTEQDFEIVAEAMYYARFAYMHRPIQEHWADVPEYTRGFYRSMSKASFAAIMQVVLERAQNGEQHPLEITSDQGEWGEIH